MPTAHASQTPLPAPDTSRAAPIAQGDRIAALDILRGVAMLGILPVNIMTSFAVIHITLFNPSLAGPLSGAERWAYLVMHLGFEMKMMTLFSLLFGAGMVVFTQSDPSVRLSSATRRTAGRYYLRLGWLALFGLIHAYGLWYGDILFTYAICALPVYLLRNCRPATLLAIGIPLIMVAVVIFLGLGGLMHLMRGNPDAWKQVSAEFHPSAEAVAAELAARGGGNYFDLLKWNFPNALMMHLAVFPLFAIWRIFGLMLVGMALFKLGILSARASTGTYFAMVIFGFVIGLPMQYLGFAYTDRSNYDPAMVYGVFTNTTYIASLFIAAGYIGVVMLAVRAGMLGFFGKLLASVGQMAFTCYLMQTAICITLFTFLGYFSKLSRVELWGVTIAIWIFQMLFATLWLTRFRFGPAEWLWRSLIYLKPQPMLRSST
ncbi:MAG: DUF418 domain-containing protein [Phycisphaerales bacterium]|nr:DUF418 domain-containing protein [Phycisphaerales bacterium]